MKTVAGKHRRRKLVGTVGPLGLVAVGWLGMGMVPGAGVPTASPVQHQDGAQAPSAPISAADQAPATAAQAGQADADDLQLAASTRKALLSTAELTDIPAKAIADYQRAALVINSSDKACHLDWTTLAAIGKVESDHGRDTRGKTSSAGVFGVLLNGKHNTGKVRDSDGGKLDGNKVWDRAVGPMQFLPSTWAVVGVDGNGDGVRDPQNLADAALGAAVYLCGDGDDLATRSGQRAAVGRYNHSGSYIDLVLSIAKAYAASEPAYSAAQALPVGHVYDATPVHRAKATKHKVKKVKTTTKKTKTTGAGSTAHSPYPVKIPPTTDPTGGPTTDPTGGPTTDPTGGSTTDPTGGPTTDPTGGSTTDPTGGSTTDPTGGPTTPGGSATPGGNGGQGTVVTKKVFVPTVTGRTLDGAGSALTRVGLKPGPVTWVYSSDVNADTVISSPVQAGSKVKQGSSIPMTVSAGPVPVLPVGLTVDQAKDFYAALAHPIAVSQNEPTYASSETVAKDLVVSATQVAQDAAPGLIITLTVSTGPAPVAP